MKVKSVASSLAFFIALSANKTNALELANNITIETLNKSSAQDERYLTEDVSVKKGKNGISIDLVKLNKGDKVEVVEEDGEWAKVRIGEEIGYIRLENLKRSNIQVIVKYLDGLEYLDVYSDMSGYESAKIGKIYQNDKINTLEEIGPYIRIQWKDGTAYIENKKDYVVKEMTRVVKVNTTVYSKVEGSSVYKKIQKGTEVTVEDVLAEYCKVRYKDGYGYIKKDELVDIKHVGKENLRSVNLYVKPDDNSEIRTYIPSGSEVEIMSYYGEYAYVKYGEYRGYIKYDNLSMEELILIKTRKDEYLSNRKLDRGEIESEYEVIVKEFEEGTEQYDEKFKELTEKYGLIKISAKKEIKIIKNRGKYLEVTMDGEKYYMDNKGDNGQDVERDLTYIHTEPNTQVTVNTRYISRMDSKVYLSESKEKVLGLLTKDAQVELVEEINDNISKIKINGGEVFVDTSSLSSEKMYKKVDKKINEVQTNKSHKEFVEVQSKKLNTVLKSSGTEKATPEELAYHSNPKRISVWNEEQRYQYLKIDTFRMIDASKLNKYLNSIPKTDGKANIFEDKADVFIAAAKKYDIDPVYLVAHTLLETGQGKSKLAQGLKYKDKGMVYNFFGIGAVDSDPIEGGKYAAYKNGWVTVDKTIEGSAKWLAENYIHRETNKQNTLYKMRYNYMTKTHQYASDIKWASKISLYISKLSYLYIDTTLVFEVPLYKSGTYVSGIKVNNKVDEVIKDNKEEKPPVDNDLTNKPDKEEKPPVDNDLTNKPDKEEKPPVDNDLTNKPDKEEKPPVDNDLTNKPDKEEKPPVDNDLTNKPDEEEKPPVDNDSTDKPDEEEVPPIIEKPIKEFYK